MEQNIDTSNSVDVIEIIDNFIQEVLMSKEWRSGSGHDKTPLTIIYNTAKYSYT